MSTIIDRYMLRQFIQVFIICLMSLIGLYIVIDAFSHLDHFIDDAGKHGSLLKVMGEYYAYRGVEFFDRTSGVLTLIAVMFTVTWIQRHHEMTALLAAGISRTRVLRPVLLAAIFVSLCAAANRELVMPNIREHLTTDSKNIGGDDAALMQSRRDSQTDILIGGDRIVPAHDKIVSPSFVLPRSLDQFGKPLTASEAIYMPPTGERPGGYVLVGVTAPKAIIKGPSLPRGDKPIIL
ncbi:MAG TPA: LptF/LptG family permease, partial [Lacipirellulaceae bacterium]|nr:LptF/LptG family permease [Lacipirellulaceae bacterium]